MKLSATKNEHQNSLSSLTHYRDETGSQWKGATRRWDNALFFSQMTHENLSESEHRGQQNLAILYVDPLNCWFTWFKYLRNGWSSDGSRRSGETKQFCSLTLLEHLRRFVSCHREAKSVFPVGLTAEEAAFVETLAVALHLLGVIDRPAARRALVASSPVWHRRASEWRKKEIISGGAGMGGMVIFYYTFFFFSKCIMHLPEWMRLHQLCRVLIIGMKTNMALKRHLTLLRN